MSNKSQASKPTLEERHYNLLMFNLKPSDRKAIEAHITREIEAARINELENFNPFWMTDHIYCPVAETCVGYQNALSDFDNEKALRLKELDDERILNKR